MFTTYAEAQAAFRAHQSLLAAAGIILPSHVASYTPAPWKNNFQMAMDAQPSLATFGNSGIPAWLTATIDPDALKVLFSPNKAAEIAGERKRGTWLDSTAIFPVIEHTGETTAYGDYNESGLSGINTNFPNRQSFVFQVVKQYGEREAELAGLAKINFVSEIDQAAATALDKFMNLSYFFGIGGLLCYGLLNDPSLPAAVAPSPKAYGGNAWVVNNVTVATANEIFSDIQSLVVELILNSAETIESDDPMTLAMSSAMTVALDQTNAFGLSVKKMLKDTYPNITVKTAIQYGTLSVQNPQGLSGGNFVQLIAGSVEGQDSLFCAFSEKMRTGKIIPAMSSWRQKVTAGTWGTIIRQPWAIAGMQGV